ncbi:MAG: helix-turn-helix transcriptional regulator [Lachnospiraceae bacterium]|nr:helix-turn-helix transcriptional regulator [Lachnospiraceae bacterium]
MYEEDFPIRLAKLRTKKGVSARDMSLSIGQNAGYINNIETGKALPSMSSFFYICEYLNISPHEFFDFDTENPRKLQLLVNNLKQLDSTQFDNIYSIVEALSQIR